MNVEIRFDCSEIDWNVIPKLLREAGMSFHSPEIHKKAFENSHTTVFAWQDDRLIGCGRAISDGAYQAALYDVAVMPQCQGRGIGTLIMEHLLGKLPHCNCILYAAPGKEGFYKTLGFGKMKTGMALFQKHEAMVAKGFVE